MSAHVSCLLPAVDVTSCLNVGWGPHKLAEFGDVVNNLAGILLFVGVCVCVMWAEVRVTFLSRSRES